MRFFTFFLFLNKKTVLDILRRNSDRQGNCENAHSENVRHLPIQSASFRQFVHVCSTCALRGPQGAASLPGLAQQREAKVPRRKGGVSACAEREHHLVASREACAHDGSLFCGFNCKLARAASLQTSHPEIENNVRSNKLQ